MKQRATKQKQIVFEELGKFKSFFTAEELYEKVKSKKISLATIYRFLKNLIERNEIHSYQCDRRTIYSLEKKSHCHFICNVCGQTKHFDVKKIDFIQKEVKGKVCHFQIDVTGTCEKCIRK